MILRIELLNNKWSFTFRKYVNLELELRQLTNMILRNVNVNMFKVFYFVRKLLFITDCFPWGNVLLTQKCAHQDSDTGHWPCPCFVCMCNVLNIKLCIWLHCCGKKYLLKKTFLKPQWDVCNWNISWLIPRLPINRMIMNPTESFYFIET